MMEWKQRVLKLSRFDVEMTKKNPRGELIDILSILKVESTSNRCHNFQVDSPFKIDVISTNFPRGISTSNRRRMDKDVSIGYLYMSKIITSYTLLLVSEAVVQRCSVKKVFLEI